MEEKIIIKLDGDKVMASNSAKGKTQLIERKKAIKQKEGVTWQKKNYYILKNGEHVIRCKLHAKNQTGRSFFLKNFNTDNEQLSILDPYS